MIRTVEVNATSRDGVAEHCEDVVVATEHFAAVFDGATAKTMSLFDGRSPGRFAAETLAAALGELDRDSSLEEAEAFLTRSLGEALGAWARNARPEARPSASCVIYSDARREIWRLADGTVRIGDKVWYQRLAIDEVAAAARAAMLRAELVAGRSMEELLQQDVGREMIRPLLRRASHFRNRRDAGNLGFGAFDGTGVPLEYFEVFKIERGVHEIVLATDGYPEVHGTLSQSEAALEKRLAKDPLMIDDPPATKGRDPRGGGFDDRAYLRCNVG